MGLRSEKKKVIREKILKAASELLLINGYENTTTDQIAEKAGIGVGTLYNYFKSKADIFIEVFAEEFEDDENIIEIKEYSIECISDIILSYGMIHIKKVMNFNKNILKDLVVAAFGMYKKNPKLFRKLIDMDYKMMDKFALMINSLKDKNILSHEVNTKDVVELIYSAMAYEFFIYLFEDDKDIDEIKENIRRKVKLILGTAK
ncbi:TetR/AcrR family transcriptional regulator [Herbivorax sp. ANBcel31]|uniref:TetR/AcrR family transcriptional regulator n=1 Tax=Herbivorax sp. ANBcel31 TaxID=3069754 RepID=UPI0027B430C4|nr:TetR/AcrR family transcriptional regulator [Herbivorax sp. ANBcel31]MDQ2086242.1 TetR/AcrR family transcriptional regulator [Herbivorax sp. ANBcel31]